MNEIELLSDCLFILLFELLLFKSDFEISSFILDFFFVSLEILDEGISKLVGEASIFYFNNYIIFILVFENFFTSLFIEKNNYLI